MFGDENDRPYEFDVDTASTATMAYVIGRLRPEITVPFGVNVLWDPMSSIALAAATGAHFVREIFTGTYASDMGPWTPDAGRAMRYRDRLGRKDLALFYNVSAEFAYSLDQRSLPDRARSAVFSSIPDAILVSGAITGEAAKMADLEAVKSVLPDTPVLANTGVKHATVAEVLRIADGCVVGSSLKVDGNTWNPVDPERAAEFMRIVRQPGKFALPDVPIIMLTGHVERERVVEAMRLGVNEFLCKPVSAKALQQRIMSIRGNPRPMVRIGEYYGPEPRKVKANNRHLTDSAEPVWV